MILRRGKACALMLEACRTPDPLMVTADAGALFRDLLAIFDACAAVGGGGRLRLSPVTASGTQAIAFAVPPDGQNVDMLLSALTSCPLLQPARKGWLEKLVGYNLHERRFILPVSAV